MANPSPGAIQWIRNQSPAWSTQTNGQIASTLNATMVNNPVTTAPQVPVTLSMLAMVGMLTDPVNGSANKLAAFYNLPILKNDIDTGNKPGVLVWIAKLQSMLLITSGESATLTAYVNSTVPDPNWTAKVPAPMVGIGRMLDADDVAAARTAGS